jgi:hypothetical protein
VRVDLDAAALADREPGARASSSRGRMPAENTTSRSRGVPSANTSRLRASRPDDFLGALLQVDRRAERSIFCAAAARRVVELHRHQARRELDDVRLEAEVLQRLGRLQAEQAAADHHADLRAPRRGGDHLEVLDRAVDEAVAPVLARHRGTNGYEPVASTSLSYGTPCSAPSARPCARVDAEHRVVQAQRHAVSWKNFFGRVQVAASCRRRSW